METWFENIRNPTVHTLMNNLDNHFWLDYLHTLTDNISQEGLVQDVESLYDATNLLYTTSNFYVIGIPYYVSFMQHFILDFDEEKLALYTPHLSKKVAAKVFVTISFVIKQMIGICYILTEQMDCDCEYIIDIYDTPMRSIGFDTLHGFYKVPTQDSDPNYWLYFKEAASRNVCMMNYTSQVCKVEKSDQNRILSDNTIWDNFADEILFFSRNFEHDKKRSASKLAYSTCHKCLSACNIDYDRNIIRSRVKMDRVLISLSQGISASLLISACAVYSMTPKLRRNINGKSTLCHLVALTVTSLFLFINEIMLFNDPSSFLFSKAEKIIPNEITALVTWYSTLSAFFWLNCICLDTFIGIWRGRRFFIKESSRFKIYMVFSWGLPLVITIELIIIKLIWNSVALRQFYTKMLPLHFERNGERVLKDYSDGLIRWLWEVPLAASLLLNLLIFAATAFVLYHHARQIKILGSGNSRCSNRVDPSRASIYLRLFSLVGIHWVVQMYGWRTFDLYPFIQIIGNLQGSITFLLVICRESTVKAFKTRHNPGKLVK